MTSPYKPVSFTSESVNQQKLQQVANNIQWLFENTPRMRYAALGYTKDSGVKILSGKTVYKTSKTDWVNCPVYFGSFFTVGCSPIITLTIESNPGAGWRKYASIRPLSGKMDHTGFIAQVVSFEGKVMGNDKITAGGFVHWHAVGY